MRVTHDGFPKLHLLLGNGDVRMELLAKTDLLWNRVAPYPG